MNKLMYLGAAVVVIAIVAVVVLLTSSAGSAKYTTTTAAPVTTIPATTSTNTTYKTTTVNLPSNSSVNTTSSGCTAEKYFTCSNLTYSYFPSNKTYTISALISQDTGTSWSSFGVGYAPQGTTISGGVPAITFYVANSTSASVGTSLNALQLQKIRVPGKAANATTKGTLWACYANSGILYVGTSGCVAQGGGAAIYVPIATITAS